MQYPCNKDAKWVRRRQGWRSGQWSLRGALRVGRFGCGDVTGLRSRVLGRPSGRGGLFLGRCAVGGLGDGPGIEDSWRLEAKRPLGRRSWIRLGEPLFNRPPRDPRGPRPSCDRRDGPGLGRRTGDAACSRRRTQLGRLPLLEPPPHAEGLRLLCVPSIGRSRIKRFDSRP